MPKKHRVLVVDDEESITYLVKTELEDLPEFEVDTALSGSDAINLIQSKVYDVVLLDVKMPRIGGVEVLKYIKEHAPTTQVIILTNVVDVKTAIETTKLGAYDYVSKPYETAELLATVRRALEHKTLVIDKEVNQLGRPDELIGECRVFKDVVNKAMKLASSEAFVLIQGASGTGKELFARLVHQHSTRKDQPFIAVNCAAMPDQLLESELFGHEKGSFTSAIKTKQGLVEVADGGTLFLDEVGDISITTQPKLLRFLETGEFRRVGGTSSRTVDVRVVSATNKNLQEEVKASRFREDLLYRLNVVSLRLPDLKERKEDIPLLVENFLSRKTKTKHLSPEAFQVLMSYDWPGNVRELEHVIEGAVALSHSDSIETKDLWMNVALNVQSSAASTPLPLPAAEKLMKIDELEKVYIEQALKHHRWNRVKTAATLGITPKTLYLKIKRYKIQVPTMDSPDE
ncbi:MAG: sigma-54-dependent Fis family transcriptional regulator [Ignavibacteriae bacterium]|nr:MAG: sigma-54-dependent Fis family transcriptional regulator [Ignavibacteriota bacterium]